jgi:hypothetical protein
MKKIAILTLFTLSSILSFAQSDKANLVKLDIGLWNKFRVTYEHTLNSKFSVGSSLAYHFASFSGVKVDPFLRFYFGDECPEGLYVQARALAGFFSKTFTYYSDDLLYAIERKTNVSSYGAGLDLGYQWLSGKNDNIVIDISIGTQFMTDVNNSIVENGITYNTANIGFNTTGPGAIFNPRLAIGYKF